MTRVVARQIGERTPRTTKDRLCQLCQKLSDEALQYIVLELYTESCRNSVLYSLKYLKQSAEHGCQLCTLIFRSVVGSENVASDLQGEDIEFYTMFLSLPTNTHHESFRFLLKMGSDTELPSYLTEGCIDLTAIVSALGSLIVRIS